MVSTAGDISSAFTREQDPVTAPETCSRRTSWSCMTGCLADCWTVQPMQWLRPGLLLVGEAARAAREPVATRYWVAFLTPAAAAVRRRVPRVRVRCRVAACSAAEPCAGTRYLVGSPTCGAQVDAEPLEGVRDRAFIALLSVGGGTRVGRRGGGAVPRGRRAAWRSARRPSGG